MRCFVAIELDRALRQLLAGLLRNGLPRSRDVRWCTEQQLHVTLKFLGEVDQRRLADVCDVVAAAAQRVEPFELTLNGLGAFPSPQRPRVLWCGVDDPAGGCAAWLAAAEPGLAALGFEPEGRAFHPHITLGRSRRPAGGRVIQQVLDAPPTLPAAVMSVNRVVLFESVLSPTGARYRAQFMASLGG